MHIRTVTDTLSKRAFTKLAVVPSYIFQFEVYETQTISGQFSSDSEITVDWGDGTEDTYNGDDQAYSKDYGSVGTRTVQIFGDSEALTKFTMTNYGGGNSVRFGTSDLPASMVTIGVKNTGSVVTGDVADLPSPITQFDVESTNSVITGDIADLPPTINRLVLKNTSSDLSGDIADAPSTLAYLFLNGSDCAVTGDVADFPTSCSYYHVGSSDCAFTGSLADFPSSISYFYAQDTSSEFTGSLSDLPGNLVAFVINNTNSTITGGSEAISATGMRWLYVGDCGLTETQVDGIVERIYTDRDSFTQGSPVLSIDGTNAAPSGTYQDGDPPTTGKEYIYELVEDPETEGFNTWTITYTA